MQIYIKKCEKEIFSHLNIYICIRTLVHLVPDYRQAFPQAGWDEVPEGDKQAEAPVEDNHAAAVIETSKDVGGGLGGGHQHWVVLVRIENRRLDKTRAYIGKYCRYMVHIAILDKG